MSTTKEIIEGLRVDAVEVFDDAINHIEQLESQLAEKDIDALFSHEGVNEFWRAWSENGDSHKHGVYESTWMAFRAALKCGGKSQFKPIAEKDKSPWVSVDDRLPEVDKVVLIAGPMEEPISGYLEAKGNWASYEEEEWMVGITHWMPIPPLPATEEKG